MKKWPKSPKECVMFHHLVEPIRTAIRFAYAIKRKNDGKTIPWHGYDIGKDAKASCFSPNDALRKDNLAFDLDEQGRDALDVIIGIAIQTGIEQGRRAEREKVSSSLSLARISLDSVRGAIWDLSSRCGDRDP